MKKYEQLVEEFRVKYQGGFTLTEFARWLDEREEECKREYTTSDANCNHQYCVHCRRLEEVKPQQPKKERGVCRYGGCNKLTRSKGKNKYGAECQGCRKRRVKSRKPIEPEPKKIEKLSETRAVGPDPKAYAHENRTKINEIIDHLK